MAEAKNRQLIEDRTRALADALFAAEGLELLEVEFTKEPGSGWVLRLFIDKPGATVGVDECSLASQVLNPALDVEDFIPHEYSLEVSSPGINRPLKKPAHYERVIGQKVRLKTFGPLGEPPRKNFLGTLTAVTAEAVQVDVDGSGP
ncbi:MAG: ribosome maturation factor RimP, partial [Archangium sp.]|nr:ribosome maturation factor RimP [Archangium sp.]